MLLRKARSDIGAVGVVIGPTLGPAGAGVVFRKGENGRLFLMLPMLKSPVQIPGAGFKIRFRIEQILRVKICDLVFARPFSRRPLAHLHQAAFAGAADFPRIKPALAPDDRFHQHRVELMLGRDRANEIVELMKTRRTNPFVSGVDDVAGAERREETSRRQSPGRDK